MSIQKPEKYNLHECGIFYFKKIKGKIWILREHKASEINMILNHMEEHHDTEPSKVKAQSPREDSDIAENAI